MRIFTKASLTFNVMQVKKCIFQWSPFSKLNFQRNFDESLMVSSYFSHHGLVNKVSLHQNLQGFVESDQNLDEANRGYKNAIDDVLLRSYTAATLEELRSVLRKVWQEWVSFPVAFNRQCSYKAERRPGSWSRMLQIMRAEFICSSQRWILIQMLLVSRMCGVVNSVPTGWGICI